LETRDVEDIDHLVKSELNPVKDETNSTTLPPAVNKPQRPGKGRSKVAKFQADEN
jgi:hypothetical protein